MSPCDDTAGADPDLTDAERETLAAVLDLIIPASDDGTMPGAVELDVHRYLCAAAPDVVPAVRDELARLDRHARERRGRTFASIDSRERAATVEELRAADPAFLAELARQTVMCYYQHDRVLEAIGMEPRAPYPKGYEVAPGDLSLLDPVRRRGRIYREVE